MGRCFLSGVRGLRVMKSALLLQCQVFGPGVPFDPYISGMFWAFGRPQTLVGTSESQSEPP